MMRVAIDTNVILVLFGRNSRYRFLADALAQERYTLLVSTEIMLEYEEVLCRRQHPLQAHAALLFLQNAVCVQPVDVFYRWNLIHADPDDNKFVDCAIAGNADAIVSEDAHFDTLKNIPFPAVKVLSVAEFAGLLGIEIA
jgi:uncharacterized protein